MLLIQLIVLAIVQGLTEFIPVSSSAHLILTPALFGWEDQGPAIDVAVHVGSLVAVLLYFRQDTARLFAGGIHTVTFKKTDERQQFLFIAAATIPVLIFGGLLAMTGLIDAMRSPVVIGLASIGFGILLWIADRRPVTIEEAPSTWRAVMTIGAAQALALIPGTSRSGATITAARWLGYGREDAAKFSMLLAIPVILMFGAYYTLDVIKEGHLGQLQDMALVAVFSAVAAFASIAVFMRMTKVLSFTPFVIYRIALGVILLAVFT